MGLPMNIYRERVGLYAELSFIWKNICTVCVFLTFSVPIYSMTELIG